MDTQYAIQKLLDSSTDMEAVVSLLRARSEDAEALRDAAYECMKREVGEAVYLRGLVEVSNRCIQNCYYCGIRKDAEISRYTVSESDIETAARECGAMGFGSMVLQSGEMSSPRYVDFLCRAIEVIKKASRTDAQPEGVGITLSLGVLNKEAYQRLFDAGAHRFLLRIETSNRALFAKIHPPEQTLDERIDAIRTLQSIGYQTGTGVMIGLPGQTLEMLAQDVLLFKSLDIDMVGMGPFLPSVRTPMANWPIESAEFRLQLGLNMIAVTRLICRDINIASTTALEALHPDGRNLGLRYGANVAMPNFSPQIYRSSYTLYDNKPIARQVADTVRSIEKSGRKVALHCFGDPRHFAIRTQK